MINVEIEGVYLMSTTRRESSEMISDYTYFVALRFTCLNLFQTVNFNIGEVINLFNKIIVSTNPV